MKRDQLRRLLGEDVSEDVIDSIMAENGRDVNSARERGEQLRGQLDEANARLAEFEEARKASMTAEEQWQARLDEANAQTAKAMRELNEASAQAVFAAAGMSEEDYAPFIGSIVGGTRKEAVDAAKAIADVVSSRAKAAGEAAVREAMGSMTTPAGGKPASGAVSSRADFEALTPEQRMQWVHDNPGRLSELR